MNENHTITLQDKKWGMPVRVLTLITFFLGAFTFMEGDCCAGAWFQACRAGYLPERTGGTHV